MQALTRSPADPPALAGLAAPTAADAARRGLAALSPDAPPRLAVVVDTEEEFDWSAPFDRSARGVGSIAAQERAHEIFDRAGLKPTYVCDQCVVDDDRASDVLKALRDEGRARIGAHLHPWVSEPYAEEVGDRNSFQCNLPPEIERAKLATLTDALSARFGERPVVFKAGRYGFGRSTATAIRDLGYRIDCSFVPYTDFRAMHGPSFVGTPPEPFWLDGEKTLLEVPLTRGFSGSAARLGPSLQGAVDGAWWKRLRAGAALSRLGVLERATLTPEGVDAAAQIRLLDALLKQGVRTFTMTYHSPSLEPGHTPYVRDKADLRTFLDRIERVVRYFEALDGGGFTTLEDVYDEAKTLDGAAVAATEAA